MYVRITRTAGLSTERLRALVAGYEGSDYLRRVPELPGFAAFLLGVDDRAGKLIAVSAWRELVDLEASERLADQATELDLLRKKPARDPLVRSYEIKLRRGLPQTHGWMRLSRLAGIEPERLDGLVHAFRDTDYVDGLAGMRGFGGYIFGVNRERGESVAVSNWDTRADMEASHRVAEAARRLRIQAMEPSEEPIVDSYEIVLLRNVPAVAQAQ